MTMMRGTGGLKRAAVMPGVGVLVAGGIMLTGCINVKAPDKPIEINLNVNIKQEVIVRLQRDAQDLITNNPELFPK